MAMTVSQSHKFSLSYLRRALEDKMGRGAIYTYITLWREGKVKQTNYKGEFIVVCEVQHLKCQELIVRNICILKQPLWLPVCFQVQLKVLAMTIKALHDLGPTFVQNCPFLNVSVDHLQSSGHPLQGCFNT